MSFTIQDFFLLAMKRELPRLRDPFAPGVRALNLGAGYATIAGAIALDLPQWDADHDSIPYPDQTVDVIHAYHFLEHVWDPIRMLREMERVLKPGGLINIAVPHFSGQLAFQDLDHKSFFSTETWSHLFAPQHYNKYGAWSLGIHFQLVCFIVERNPILLTQLVKLL